ncbi:hypothetical protein [Pelobacter propionicus]|uniref:Uncharacterized protein n=1 Tax=Pelobacter propionicus (strain DSM 2379 / NBRC 103807 / OttBd1) TaxID=338966 RepID=A1ATP8_PELPD|nr:hypothetical protein [Pelobacter propionicus]ABL00719.1 hypothetical protein Ppro_3125 [Pelobacter propionicus DSM 2379]
MEEQHDSRPTTSQPKIPGGCVLLSRKTLDSDLMDQSPLVVKLWVWILLKAFWKDGDKLKRGQLLTTIAEMQEAMSHYSGWRKIVPTKDELRSAYGALSKATRITTRKTTRGMIITVINYHTYQDISAYASRTENLKGIATEPPATPHYREEREEVKNTSCPEPRKTAPDCIIFDTEKDSFFNTESYLQTWEAAYPAVDIPLELAKAAAWLKANPKNRKKNYARFLNNWLMKAQDRAPRVTGVTDDRKTRAEIEELL